MSIYRAFHVQLLYRTTGILATAQVAPKTMAVKKTTFDFNPKVARRLAELKHQLQYSEGFSPHEASGVAIVSALIMSATAKQVARLLKRRVWTSLPQWSQVPVSVGASPRRSSEGRSPRPAGSSVSSASPPRRAATGAAAYRLDGQPPPG